MRCFRIVFVAAVFAVTSASARGQGYQVVTVKDGGKITGTVRWSGATPHLPSLTVTKDPQICDPQSHKTVDLERLIVGPQGGVANTVVFLKDISSGKTLDLPPLRQALDQKNCRYEPHILLVPANGRLTMRSSDATLHTVHMDGAATYNLPFPFPNQVISREMPTAGLVNLKCNGGHTWMNAEMLVVSHPYYAVTDVSGNFELSNVPPGEYTITAWHEGWSVARREASIDVLTQRRVDRPVFGPPRNWDKRISVVANTTASVNFTISDK